ncbi:MAG: NEW3 domain-containing protein, partial [Armatimonadota bacterium]
ELRFADEGLLVACNALTTEVVRPLTERPAASLRLPRGEAFLVGWARFEADEIASLLRVGDREIAQRMQPLAQRLVALAEARGRRRMTELAAASRDFVALARSLADLPGALSPVAPLTALHERLNALLVALLDVRVQVSAQHAWLAPALDKSVTVLVQGSGFTRPELAAVGSWRDGALKIAEPGEPAEARDTRIYTTTVRLDDGAYVERVVPLIATVTVTRESESFALTDILRLEANRPYQLIYAKTALTTVAGQARTAAITARNWSPLDLQLEVSGSGPEGWAVTPAARRVDAPALSDTQFQVSVEPPPDAPRGSYEVRVVANHSDREDTGFIAILPVSVMDALVPLRPEPTEWAPPAADERARIRQASKFAVYVEAGEEIGIEISNVRVTRYVDTLSWRLLSPTLEVIAEGTVPVDETATLAQVAAQSGTHWLEVLPKQGSADVHFANRWVAEVATEQDPLQLFTSSITRCFYVPEGSTGFRLGARDGGPDEGARFVITAPDGRVAFEADGNYNGSEFPVQVQPGEAGQVWTIRVEPRQDLSFWLAGDVMPYLSTSPERVLVRAGR